MILCEVLTIIRLPQEGEQTHTTAWGVGEGVSLGYGKYEEDKG